MLSVQAQGKMKTSIENLSGYEKLRAELLEANGAESLTEWDMLILAICWKESTFRKTTNKNYHGYMQMGRGYVKSVNRLAKTNYTYNDARVFRHAVKMHNLMNEHLNPSKNLKKALRIHNPRAAYHADALKKLEKIKEYERERGKKKEDKN
jgi:hypothetical protein